MNIVHIAANSPYNDCWGYQDNILPKYHKKMGHNVTIITTNKMHEDEKVVETKLRKFYTTINQVVKRAEIDFGPAKDWEWNTPQDMYDKYLKQYMQNVKEIKQDGSSSLYLYFTDGTYIVYAGTYMRFVTDNKERNDGTNSFVFMFDPKGKISKNYVEKGVFANYAYFTNITEESLYDECKTSGWYCSLLIQRNGWHIPKNYPRKL